MAWKVPSQVMPSTTPPISAPMRSFISRAALLVKVTASNLPGPGLAGGEDMGEPGGQHPGLAGAGTGQHQQGAIGDFDGGALLGVQALQIGRFGLRHGARRQAARLHRRGRAVVAEIIEVEWVWRSSGLESLEAHYIAIVRTQSRAIAVCDGSGSLQVSDRGSGADACNDVARAT